MDINCDLGEGMANDHLIMPYLDSCNIACGGHVGDRYSMLRTIDLAESQDVKIGAHPSFEDKEGFGRKEVYVPLNQLKSQLIHQIASLNELVKSKGLLLNHVKAHGALYNLSARYSKYATLLIETLLFFKEPWFLYVPFGSVLEKMARKQGIKVKVEVFADRQYTDDLKLLPRSEPEAVITNIDKIKKQVYDMITKGEIRSNLGNQRKVRFDTLCVHGDHPDAVEIVKSIRELKT